MPTSFALIVHYSEGVSTKENEDFVYRGEGCMDVFAEKIENILQIWQIFLNKKIFLQKKTRQDIGDRRLVIYTKVNLSKVIKIIAKSEIVVAIQEIIKELHIQHAI